MNFKKSFVMCLSILTVFAHVSLCAMEPLELMSQSYFADNFNKGLTEISNDCLNNSFIQDKNDDLTFYNLDGCPVCLNKIDIKHDHLIILSCKHIFHKNCIVGNDKKLKLVVCPCCRRDVEYAMQYYQIENTKESKKINLELNDGDIDYCSTFLDCIIF